MKRTRLTSIIGLVMAVIMCISLLPSAALAADSDFEIENGVLMKYTGNDSHVVIPNHVTSIGEGAFAMVYIGIESITIPNSVTSIGDYAFSDCYFIESITIPESVTSIGTMVFADCIRLASVTIPESVTSIGDHMFYRTGFFSGGLSIDERTIYGKTGSYAETYAKEQGVKFVSTGAVTQTPAEPDKPAESTKLTSQLPGQAIPLTDDEFKWYVAFIGYLRELQTIFPLIVDNRTAYQNARGQFATKDAALLLEANSLRAEGIVANARKMLQRFPGGTESEMLRGLDTITAGFKTITNPYVDDYDYNKTADMLKELIITMENLYISMYGPIDGATPIEPAPTTPTTDQPSAWAEAQVNTAIAANIVPTALQGQYTQATTRAEFCALAVALYETVKGTEITQRTTFSDTTDINVQKAAAIGVVSGVGDNNFAPNDTLTREQAATMLSRLAAAIGKPLTEQTATFADNNSISEWAFSAVGQVQANGVMGGVGDNTFAPKSEYTREQSMITMSRLYDIVK